MLFRLRNSLDWDPMNDNESGTWNILTAAGGLSEIGPLRYEQRDLAEVVETEASRLGQLTLRLLRLARLDREEVKPQMDPAQPKYVLTEPWVGYRFHNPTDSELESRAAEQGR